MKTNNIKEKIKEFFFINPTTKLRVRQIERELKLPLPSVIRYTKELENEEILKKIIISNISIYSANRSSKKYLLEKKLFNIKSLFISGMVDFIIEEFHNPVIIVFGSYAKGEDTENSDIDIFVESQKNKGINLKTYENRLKRKIQFFIYKNIKGVSNKELANNILNGIIINGYIEVFK